MKTTKGKRCSHCNKDAYEVGQLVNCVVQGPTCSIPYRLCQRCRWLFGIPKKGTSNLTRINNQLLKHKQSLVTIKDYGILRNQGV